MGLKKILRQMIWRAAQVPPLRRALIVYYERKPSDYGWNREHPYDRAHDGVRTSGMLPGFLLRPGEPMDTRTTIYSAVQPSIIRKALATIPDPQHCHFLDLGCGKGRPLLIATEFGFATITGVELSPTLSGIARRNAAVFSRVHPDRTPINIVTGDALAHKLPGEKLVVFLYNPFERPLIARLLTNIESSLQAISREFYIVYYNPTWADVLDASSALERRYAAQLPYDPSEIGYGPDKSDAVVVWQNRGNPHPRPPGNPASPVTIVSPGRRAEIASIDVSLQRGLERRRNFRMRQRRRHVGNRFQFGFVGRQFTVISLSPHRNLCTTGTASKWRVRYARDRFAGFSETGNRGAEAKYKLCT